MKVSAGVKWIAIVVCLLAGNVVAGVVLIGASHHGASRVLDGYYEQAVHYDDAIDAAARDRALGWSVDVTIEHGLATVTAVDANRHSIDHARVELAGVERAATARTIHGELAAAGAGAYRAQLGGAGWIDLAVTVERGRDRYVRRFAIEAR